MEQGALLPVAFSFHRRGSTLSGDFTCPTQQCLQYPLDSVNEKSSTVHFVLGGGMTFVGSLQANTLLGTFQDGSAKGTFSLRRSQIVLFPYKVQEVRFKNGDVTLAGTLCIPRSAGRHPAIVFDQGSGPESRWGTNRYWADQFARAGIAALCYDKRGSGASTGDWRKADFNDLAHDCLAGVHLLKTHPDIAPTEIGIYGHSQGGFIAPLIASQSPDVAFVVAADSPGGPAYEQDIFRVRTSLTDEGYSPADIAEAMTFFALFLHVARTGTGWEQLDAALPAVRNENWFEDVAPPPRGNWLYAYYRKTGDYNSLPFWAKVHVPVLLLYGERDHNTPPGESIRNIEAALAKAGNTRYAAVLLPDAVHNDTIQPAQGKPFYWWHTAPGLSDVLIGWVRQQVSSLTPPKNR